MKDNIFDGFSDLANSNADIAQALTQDFTARWKDEFRPCPVIYVDYVNVWTSLKVTSPEVLGSWNEPLLCTPELEAVAGQLAEPLADYVTLTRKCNVNQVLNLFANLGYVELVFDFEKGSEAYQIADRDMPDHYREGIEEVIAANLALGNV